MHTQNKLSFGKLYFINLPNEAVQVAVSNARRFTHRTVVAVKTNASDTTESVCIPSLPWIQKEEYEMDRGAYLVKPEVGHQTAESAHLALKKKEKKEHNLQHCR